MHSANNDLSLSSSVCDSLTLANHASMVGIEIVCASWSTARRAPVGSSFPRRVRRRGCEIWGLRDLDARDRTLVLAGNRMLRGAIRVIKRSLSLHQCGYLENPRSSLMWHILRRVFRRELASGEMSLLRIDMCRYGTAYKKPTTILVWGKDSHKIVLKQCNYSGICVRTGLPHEQLSSSSSCKYCVVNGAFRTSAAQVYPPRFVAHLLDQLWSLHRS